MARQPAPDEGAVIDARKAGGSVKTIAQALKCSESTIRRILTNAGLNGWAAWQAVRVEPDESEPDDFDYQEATAAANKTACRLHLADLFREHGLHSPRPA